MGLLAKRPQQDQREESKDLFLDFSCMTSLYNDYLPAEWNRQRMIQLTWPHEHTDWAPMLEEAEECFTRIVVEIARRERVLIVVPCPERVQCRLTAAGADMSNVGFFACDTNDTWARDHAFITMLCEGKPRLMDFRFNGWGKKFPAELDNVVNRKMYDAQLVEGSYENRLDFVLEGGSIESDGAGTLLTTVCCLTAPNRNRMSQAELERYLLSAFNLQRVLWLHHGHLTGDDTDGHIDTLARFCPGNAITYVQCLNPDDEEYGELHRMEEEIKTFRTLDGAPYRLFPLPIPDPVYHDGERLPATYANFLIMNGAVLYPTYASPELDKKAGTILAQIFPGREIVGIDCRALIKQHGSLHCVTMQYPL